MPGDGNFSTSFTGTPGLTYTLTVTNNGPVIATASASCAPPPPPTATPAPPTATPRPPTNTPVPPTATPVPPTNTPVPPTNTPVPPTVTPVPPTNTPVPPTATPIPPTATPNPPSLTVNGSCASGTVTFVITNNGGAMSSAYTYQVKNTGGTVVSSGNVQLGAGASQTVSFAAQPGETYTISISNGSTVVATMSTTCAAPPPSLTLSGVCNNGTVSFVVTNSGGAMSSAYTYSVTNTAGTVVNSGNIQLGASASQTITFAGQAGQVYTISVSNGQTVVATMSATCAQGPSFTSSGTCSNGTVSFVLTNNGGAMSGTYTYQVTNSSGTVVNSGTVQLTAGQSQTISFAGLAGQVYTLRVSNGATVVVTMTATCATPPTPVPPTRTPIPPTNTPPPTPTCGRIIIDANGFPIVDMSGCNEDNSKPPRAKWNPIKPGPAVCEDWLVYHTNKSAANTWDVYRLGDIPGKAGTPVNLTQGPKGTYSVAPALSPDRRTIAFYTNRDNNWEIYVASTDGLSAPQRVSYNTFAVDQDPVWSPDGRYILYESSRRGNFDLYLVDVTIGPDSETPLATGPANEVNAYFAPDGKSVIYESQSQGTSQIFVYDLATQKTTKISDGKGADFNPTFSPDGKKIAYRSYRDNGAVGVLYVADATGANAKAISDGKRTATNHSWSPDGKYIAWQSDLDGVMSVYVADVATGQTRQATDKLMAGNKDAVNYAPTWYCKGPQLVFTSDVTGTSNVFTIPALPLTAPPVKVDTAATKLTDGKGTEKNQYAENSPNEEDASRLGLAPTTPTRR